MKNYKIIIQYDGTKYKGWQRLKNSDLTIQGKIEAVLSKMVEHKVEIHGSGRTDAGVHALSQTASFKIETPKTEKQIMDYLNRYLPDDIGIISVKEADERFHARLNVKSKTYQYRIWNSELPCIFERKYTTQITSTLDIERMKKAAEYLIGTHDFKAFCSNKKLKKSSVRTIDFIDIKRVENEVRITIQGNGFLHNMVRIICGTLVEIGLYKRETDSIPEILNFKIRENAGETLPAKGLTLLNVEY